MCFAKMCYQRSYTFKSLNDWCWIWDYVDKATYLKLSQCSLCFFVPWVVNLFLSWQIETKRAEHFDVNPYVINDSTVHRILRPLVLTAIFDMIHVEKERERVPVPAFDWWDFHAASSFAFTYKSSWLHCAQFEPNWTWIWVAIKMWFCWFIAHTKRLLRRSPPRNLIPLSGLLLHEAVLCVCLPAVFVFAKLIGNKIPQQLRITIWDDDASRTLRQKSVQMATERERFSEKFHHLRRIKRNKEANIMTDIRHTRNNECLAAWRWQTR